MYDKVAKSFWKSLKDYPRFGSKARRFYEVQWLIPKIYNYKSLLDIGCGSGELLDLLLRMTDIDCFYGVDISQSLLLDVDPRVETSYYDIYAGGKLPKVDCVLLWASLQYIFDDKIITRLLMELKCKKLFVRTPCTDHELVIDNYSEELQGRYASRYTTVEKMIELLGVYFKVESVERIYPDEIESKFGSRQYVFECKKI